MKPLFSKICSKNRLVGTILLANEGLNGTVAGPRAGIENLLTFLFSDPRFKALQYKESFAATLPFRRLKIRIKKEIVTMGVPGTDPRKASGKRIDAKEWNKLIKDPDVLMLDTRNEYEHEVENKQNANGSLGSRKPLKHIKT